MFNVPHCPFLNRSDPRCARFLCLDRLDHAFEHCFDDYAGCSLYHQLNAERHAPSSSRMTAAELSPPLVQLTVAGQLPSPAQPRSRVLSLFGL